MDGTVEEFHVLTRNISVHKRFIKSHESSYSPVVLRLVAHAPLHLEGVHRVAIDKPHRRADMPLGEAMSARHSGRTFGTDPLPLEDLGSILLLANGVMRTTTIARDVVFYHRSTPNSGGLGCVEVFCIALSVKDLRPGIYHFDSVSHDLAMISDGDLRNWLRSCVLFQREFSSASVALVLVASLDRLSEKYGARGYRLALIDVGCVCENIYLVSTALGLQVCAAAGFVDSELDRALGIDGLERASMLVVLVGTAPKEAT